MNIKKILLATFCAFGPMTGSMLGSVEEVARNRDLAVSFITNSKNTEGFGAFLSSVKRVLADRQLMASLSSQYSEDKIQLLQKLKNAEQVEQVTPFFARNSALARTVCLVDATKQMTVLNLQEQIQAAEKRAEVAQRQIEELNEKNAAFEKEMDEKHEANEALTQQVEEMTAQVQEQEKRGSKYKKMAKELQSNCNSIESELRKTKLDLRNAQQEARSFAGKAKRLETEKLELENRLKSERRQYHEEISKSEKELERTKNGKLIPELKERIQELEEQVQELSIGWTDVIPVANAIQGLKPVKVGQEERYYLPSTVTQENVQNYLNFLLSVFRRIENVARALQRGKEKLVYGVNYEEQVEHLQNMLSKQPIVAKDEKGLYIPEKFYGLLVDCKEMADAVHSKDRPMIEMYLAQFNLSLSAVPSRSPSELINIYGDTKEDESAQTKDVNGAEENQPSINSENRKRHRKQSKVVLQTKEKVENPVEKEPEPNNENEAQKSKNRKTLEAKRKVSQKDASINEDNDDIFQSVPQSKTKDQNKKSKIQLKQIGDEDDEILSLTDEDDEILSFTSRPKTKDQNKKSKPQPKQIDDEDDEILSLTDEDDEIFSFTSRSKTKDQNKNSKPQPKHIDDDNDFWFDSDNDD